VGRAVKTRRSHFLDNGRGFNNGQDATLIEIECEQDLDDLLQYIVDSDFYGRAYLPRQSGQSDQRLTGHFWWVAEIVAALSPRLVLEIGCGRGDVLRLLTEEHGADVAGIDFGSALPDTLWPSLRNSFHGGDILEILRDWHDRPYDVACGFDIWEHLLPRTLDDTIVQLVANSTDDALFIFVIPAFGDDSVFDEQFPLEFEENREAFNRREPFRFLLADPADERVPAAGHLTWAHTDWWVEKFRNHGLVRETSLERALHRIIDPHVPHSIKAFYVFRKPTVAAQQRVAALATSRSPALASLGAIWRRRRYERRTGARFTVGTATEIERWLGSYAGPLAPLATRVVPRVTRVMRRRT
jgi:SAM-dependent methyltransferase